MLTAVKSQARIACLSIKYALMREMLNKATFISNVFFMILNNASFIIQWVILFSIRDNFGGYTLKEVLLLWGFAALTYGISRFFFMKAFTLSYVINNGKLDSFLVQPKNVLISAITTDVSPSALGDILYAYIILFIYGFTIKNFFLYTFCGILGGLIVAAIAVILNSLSFWFQKTDVIAENGNNLMTNFATYPDGIFKGIVKVILYTIVPVGFANYMPVQIMIEFDWIKLLIVLGVTILIISLAFLIFYRGLKRYSSSNLMIARI